MTTSQVNLRRPAKLGASKYSRGHMEFATSFEITSEVLRLRAFYNGLSRGKDQILLYLAEVYKTAKRMRTHKRRDVLQQIHEDLNLTLDARVSRNPYRLLIELTCTRDVQQRSRYANALKFARHMQWGSSQVRNLIAENGGIEKCERAYLQRKKHKRMIPPLA